MYSEVFKENSKMLREKMKEMLAQCKPEQQIIFGKMYNHLGKHGNHVDGVDEKQLDWAFKQIEKTLSDNLTKQEIT